MPNPRKIAVDILFSIIKEGSYLNSEMDRVRKNPELTETDIKFINEIIRGVLKHKIFLDEVIKLNSNTKLNKIAPYILCILEVGVYQIYFMDRVPNSAAVNESVKIVKKSSSFRLSSYVNAVLRGAVRCYDNGSYSKLFKDPRIKYSYPKWLWDRFTDKFGIDFTCKLAEAMEKPAPLILRANTLKTTAHKLCESLNADGVNATVIDHSLCPSLNCAIECDGISRLEELTQYKDGLFYVQDISSQIAVMTSGVKPNDTVIDMCSAPGGKATFMAELMKNKGKIFAFDIYDQKVDKIRQNVSRLGIDIIDAKVLDASVYNKEFENTADVVFCDVPCSGFGILRKKPDIKYKRSEEDLKSLAELSLKILDNASKYLKSGGTLIFSTCTIDPEENEENLFKFLDEHKNFSLKKIDCISKENEGYFTTYPHIDKTDGFFVAKLIKDTECI